jgi:signal peptidase I
MAKGAEREPEEGNPMDETAETVDEPKKREDEGWAENVKTIVYALLIALVLRTLLFQPFHIPSESMVPTLLTGDYIFASKFTYGYSRHSMPLSPPLFDGRILGRDPQRGEIAVFKWPGDNRTDYIKRVIGLPGDTIQVRGGTLYINNEPAPREFVKTVTEDNPFGGSTSVDVFRETLPNGVDYLIYDMGPREADDTRVYVVPEDHYFMMGDNRDDSRDSRYFDAVAAEAFVGKAQIVFFSVNENFRLLRPWTWFNFRPNRFFHSVKAQPDEL